MDADTLIQKIVRYVGANVRRLREERGWTQKDLGEKAKCGWRSIQVLEIGTGNPGLRLLVAVAHALGVKPVELLKPARHQPRDAGRPPSE